MMFDYDLVKPFEDMAKAQTRADWRLVMAIMYQESKGDTYAMRYETSWRWLYNYSEFAKKNNISYETEINAQKFSWGLMQVMGSVARELGHSGPLPQLLLPSVGIEYGARQLERLKKKYSGLDELIASYNAGSPRYRQDSASFINQDYVSSVRWILKQF